MYKEKKYIVVVAIIIIIIAILVGLIIYRKKTNNINHINNYQQVFSINQVNPNIKSYLGYYKDYYYYIDGYSLADVFVVQGENNGIITANVIKKAKESINNEKSVFMLDGEKYYIENIYDAIYMQNNFVAVFLDEIENISDIVIKEENRYKIQAIEFQKNEKKKALRIEFSSNDGGDIYLKGIDISIKADDNKYLYLNEIDESKVKSDVIINFILEKYTKLYEDDSLSNELISTIGCEYNSDTLIVIERMRNENSVDYYIYFEKKKDFESRLGF